jgi:DNA-binding response OmpR family regulator
MARVLIVEDDQALCSVLQQTLENVGHAVTIAESGRTAIRLLRKDPFDLVLTDLVLPDQDGIEIIMMLRKERPAMPILAMSGRLSNAPLYLAIAQKLGAKQTLSKPFTREQLLAAVTELLPPT